MTLLYGYLDSGKKRIKSLYESHLDNRLRGRIDIEEIKLVLNDEFNNLKKAHNIIEKERKYILIYFLSSFGAFIIFFLLIYTWIFFYGI